MKRTDQELIEACLEGDSGSWSVLIDRYQRMIYAIPFRYRLPEAEAADVFQGVWIDLYRSLKNLRRAGSIRSWLITTTMRRCLLHKKRLERSGGPPVESIAEPPHPGPDPQQIREAAELSQGLRDAIESLPARCQKLLQMLFFEDPPVPYAEAARRLGLAEGSIGFIRGRCLEKLKKALDKETARDK